MIKLCKELNFDLVFFDRINKASSKSDKKRIEEILNNSEYLNSRFLYYYIGNVFDEATIFVYTTKCKFFRNFGKIEVDLLTRNGEKILLDEIPFMLDRVKWRINRKKRIVIDDKNQELILKYNFIKKEYIEPLSYSFGTNPKNKNLCIGKPEIEAMAVIAEGPGIGTISIFSPKFSIIFDINSLPGSEIPGVPASLIKAKVLS